MFSCVAGVGHDTKRMKAGWKVRAPSYAISGWFL